MREDLVHLEVGQTVVRLLAGKIKMPLRITGLGHHIITCGGYQFCRKTGGETGGEIDEYFGWVHPFPNGTGSILEKVVP